MTEEAMQIRLLDAQNGLCLIIHDHGDYVWPTWQPIQIAG
jgi:hypothetical protein